MYKSLWRQTRPGTFDSDSGRVDLWRGCAKAAYFSSRLHGLKFPMRIGMVGSLNSSAQIGILKSIKGSKGRLPCAAEQYIP